MMDKLRNILSLVIPTKGPETVLQGAIKSSIINILARGLGYLRNVAIAVLLGFSFQTDAYFMALSLMGIFLIFADVFDSIGVPELVKARIRGEEEFRRISGTLFSFTLLLTLVMTFLSVVLLPLVLKIPAGFDQKSLDATKISYLLLIPYLASSFIFHHFGAILRSQRSFSAYFIGEAIISTVNFLITALGLIIYKDFRILPISLSLSQLVGSFFMLYIGRNHIHIGFYLDASTKKLFIRFFQLSLLYGVLHLYILVDRTFASYLGEKSISALAYGLIIVNIPKAVLRFEHIAITSLSEVGGNIEKLNFYLRKLSIYTLPFLVLFFLVPHLPVKLLFGYGAFSKVDVDITAEALRYYSLSLPFMFFWPLIYRVFQIREKLILIGIVSILGVAVNGLLNYIFVFYFNLGVAGICLGTFGAYLMICGLGYYLLRRDSRG